jgi:hypothetical protein
LREASRLTTAGVAAIFPTLLVVVADKLERGGAAGLDTAGLAAATGAVDFGFITPDGRTGVFPALPNAAFPVVDIALRLSRLNSLAVLVAGCAIINPVASCLLDYFLCKTSVIKPFINTSKKSYNDSFNPVKTIVLIITTRHTVWRVIIKSPLRQT